MLALQFYSAALKPAVINGVMTAGLYGLLAVALVVSYRISRTVAFVHGGIALSATLVYWWLVTPPQAGVAPHPHLPGIVGLIMVVIGGAAIATAYAFIVTGKRMANFARITVTTFSLAAMLLLVGIAFTVITAAQGQPAPSPFGTKTFVVFNDAVSVHQLVTLGLLAVFVVGLELLLRYTRTGIYARAIADNGEASRLVGIPTSRVGTLMYALSGAASALGGALLAAKVGTDQTSILFVFLRALMVCVVGGFGSISLALAGALVMAVLDSMVGGGLFGATSSGTREVIVVGALFLVVIVISRLGNYGKAMLSEGL